MPRAFQQAFPLMAQHQVPVVVEIILERVTNIAMGTDLNGVNEFDALAESREDAPTSIAAIV